MATGFSLFDNSPSLNGGLFGANAFQANTINAGLNPVSAPGSTATPQQNQPLGATTQSNSNTPIQSSLNGDSTSVPLLSPTTGLSQPGSQSSGQSSTANPLQSNISSAAQSALKLAANSGAGSGVIGSVNAWGAENLGLGSGMQGPTLSGATADIGQLDTGMTLSGAIGGAVSGFGVGAANPFVDPNHRTGSEVGGTVGGVVGEAIGDSFGVPVIGNMVGSFIGSEIGGLFGGGKQTSANEFSGTMDNTGNFGKTAVFGQDKGTPQGAQVAQNVSQSATNLGATLSKNGINTAGIAIHGGINTKQAGGGFIDYTIPGGQSQRITFNAGDPNGLNVAINQVGDAILKANGISKTMDNLSGGQNVPNLKGTNLMNGGEPVVPTNTAGAGQLNSFLSFVNQFRQTQAQGAA